MKPADLLGVAEFFDSLMMRNAATAAVMGMTE